MRLLFKQGKQKEMITKFKIGGRYSWTGLASYLGIAPGRLKEYVSEKVLIPEEIYRKLDLNGFFSKFILERRNSNWGQVHGGRISSGKLKSITFPEESVVLAEFFGAMFGDGNSCRICSYKRGTYMIRIVGDIQLDKDYHLEYLKPMIEGLFDVRVRVGRFKSNSRFLEVHSRRLVDFLEEKGFKPGNKIKNKLIIPKWIRRNQDFLIAFLRGMYDTDGSFYRLAKQNSFQICLTCYNPLLLAEVRMALISLGINCSNVSVNQIYITKKSELVRFLKLIGFSNRRHLCRLEMFGPNLGL
jgi:hypothetical protein